tara:strand:+ start:5092 stop:5325 length:234 start_codon:yes stop_codon:yes gene_type:complete
MWEIDCHGLSHKKALNKIEEYLLINSVCKLVEVKIITGNSSELQEKIIKEILGPHKFDYYIPPNNSGVMLVTDSELI